MNQIKAVQEAKEILRASGLRIDKLSLLQKSTLSSLRGKTIDHDCAFLSAFCSEALNTTNMTESRDLKRALAACHYNITPVRASYFQSADELGEMRDDKYFFFVQNSIHDERFSENILRLSAKYGQKIALIVPKDEDAAYLLGTAQHNSAEPGFRQKDHLVNFSFDEAMAKYFSDADKISKFKEATLLTNDEASDIFPSANGMASAMGENLRGLKILKDLGIAPQKVERYESDQYKALSRARIILNAAGLNIKKLSNLLEAGHLQTREESIQHDCAILSAFCKANRKSVNIENANKLSMSLKAIDGYSVTDLVKESAVFVENALDQENFVEHILALAREFEQDAVLIVPRGAQDPYIMGATKKESALLKFGIKNVLSGATFLQATTMYFSRMYGSEYKSNPAEPLGEHEIILVRPGHNVFDSIQADHSSEQSSAENIFGSLVNPMR